MKRITKNIEPQALSDFKVLEPHASWKTGFKTNAGKEPNNEVRDALYIEQNGLCVYCEIDLKDGLGRSLDDFRVEHFYPENPKPEDARGDGVNYALYWGNMFGCCHGGSVKTVVDSADRHSSPDFHCDVPKSNNDWTGEILNPIVDIPESPLIFSFNEEGNMFVCNERCPPPLVDKATRTIELLNIDSEKLRKFRKGTIDKIKEQLMGVPINLLDQEMKDLAACYLLPDQDGCLEAFYSTIRWYLGPMAEEII